MEPRSRSLKPLSPITTIPIGLLALVLSSCSSDRGNVSDESSVSDRSRVLDHYEQMMTQHEYADELHNLDEEFSTQFEEEFESGKYSNFNLFGPREHLSKGKLEKLVEWLDSLPYETIKALDYDIILAMSSNNNHGLVDYTHSSYAGNHINSIKDDERIIRIFNWNNSTVIHEFMHAMHLSDPNRKERINSRWAELTVSIDGELHRIVDLYDQKDDFTEANSEDGYPTDWGGGVTTDTWSGFSSPYAMYNRNEDFAETGEHVYLETVFDSFSSFSVNNQKAQILLEESMITQKAYDSWVFANLKKFSPSESEVVDYLNLLDPFVVDSETRNNAWKELPDYSECLDRYLSNYLTSDDTLLVKKVLLHAKNTSSQFARNHLSDFVTLLSNEDSDVATLALRCLAKYGTAEHREVIEETAETLEIRARNSPSNSASRDLYIYFARIGE